MKKAELKKRADLHGQRAEYKRQLALTINDWTKARNRADYLRRCIKTINEKLGDQKDGQLEFKL